MTTLSDPLCEVCGSTGIADKRPCDACGGAGRIASTKGKPTKPQAAPPPKE